MNHDKKLLLKWILSFFVALVFIFSPTAFSDAPHSYADAVKLAAPAVINIYSVRGSESHSNLSNIYRDQSRKRYRLGSAVIMNAKGYVLTNHHLIQQATRVLVALDDGRRTTAKVIGSDPDTDLAVLKINLNHLQPIEIGDSNKVEVGDIVLAIGNPFGLGQTVTQGIVSAIGRSMIGINELENYIQTDAAINPGNSGGALINTQGKLIGINTAIYTRSGGYQGVGFAIPVNVALNVMQQIIQYGEVKRGWLGIEIRNLTAALASTLKINVTNGVLITRVVPNSPASTFGLKRNDAIIKINNRRVRNARSFSSFIAQMTPGESAQLTIVRQNKSEIIDIKIGTRPPKPIIDDRGKLPRDVLPGQRRSENQHRYEGF